MTLNPRCDKVETAKGVAITVTGVAQVKVIQEHDLLTTACEQFLGKGAHEIEGILLQTLEGHLRAILGTLTVEEIYKGMLTLPVVLCSSTNVTSLVPLYFSIQSLSSMFKVNEVKRLGWCQSR